jgi:4-aminobutyrate aminotransferase-like enzyme
MSHYEFGSCLPDVRVRPPGPASRALAARLRTVESRNVTALSDEWPVFWEEARGANVRDSDGNVYLDLTGAFGVALLGHGHPGVREAVHGQADRLIHGMGDVHPPALKLPLLERLHALSPWPQTRTILSSTGSEAVESALKTAQMATGRSGVLAFSGGYHGLTLGSLSVTERRMFRAPFASRLYDGVAFAPFPDPVRLGAEAGPASLERVAELLASGAPNGDGIGAVIVEPVQGRAGVRVAPDGFMSRLSELAAEAGALVIADEIFTGLGRCGAHLASARVGLRPDVVCLGKGLVGGLPLSACLARGDVMDAWPESEGEALHTSTFLGHPLACASGLAVLGALDGEAVVDRARILGARMVRELRERLAGLPGVVDVRGLGLMIGIELVEKGGSQPREGGAVRVAEAALQEGLLLLPSGEAGHVVGLSPPVELSEEQARFAVATLTECIQAVAA